MHGQGQKREQKHTTKNFDEFHNHFPLLTMPILLHPNCREAKNKVKVLALLRNSAKRNGKSILKEI